MRLKKESLINTIYNEELGKTKEALFQSPEKIQIINNYKTRKYLKIKKKKSHKKKDQKFKKDKRGKQ